MKSDVAILKRLKCKDRSHYDEIVNFENEAITRTSRCKYVYDLDPDHFPIQSKPQLRIQDFPVAGCLLPRQLRFFKILYVETKKSGPLGGCAPDTPPPPDPPMHRQKSHSWPCRQQQDFSLLKFWFGNTN